MPLVEIGPETLNLTGTRVAEYFRFGCERQLMYDLGGAPAGVERSSRPGVELLAGAGRAWERRKVRQLVRKLGPERVLIAGWERNGTPSRIPAERVVEVLRDPGEVEVLVQPELRLRDPAVFARRFGLDPERIRIAPAVPDLVRIRRGADGARRFQIVDIKAGATARIPHYAQIAYYSLLLDEICRLQGIAGGRTDRRWGRVWARDGRGPARFDLSVYRHHVARVLRVDVPRILAGRADASAWHVSTRCGGCGYLAHCRAEADGTDDLARVVGISPAAKGVLHGKSFRSVRDLVYRGRKDTYVGCHALESQGERLGKRASALTYGKLFDIETRTALMPAHEDFRVVVTVEGDPVSGRCFALGLRVEGKRLPDSEELGIWIAEQGTDSGERAIVRSFLTTIERVLAAVDAERARWVGEGRRRGPLLHFYVYDRTELDLLRRLVLRHLSDAATRPMIARLLHVLSPRSVKLHPDVVRSAPGTVLADVISTLFALPIPYAYDLPAVSERLGPSERASPWRPPADYASPFSSQISFERIHDVWAGHTHASPSGDQEPEQVRREIERLVSSKLAAIDSVVRAVRERSARLDRLQMRKEPFVLGAGAEALADPELESLRVFTEMEAAAENAAVRALHVLPAVERARRLESIRGLSFVETAVDGTLLFEFDPACRDTKLRPGDFNLVLTDDDGRSLLEVDRQPWKRRGLMMELVGYDLAAEPPRVLLSPTGDFEKAMKDGSVHLDRLCVLDRAPSDYNTNRVLGTLRALDDGRGEAGAVLEILRGRVPGGWPVSLGPPDAVLRDVLHPVAETLGRPVLNEDQEAAWRSVFERSTSVVWGPPGTGKTYLLAWIIIGLGAAARREGRSFRTLVTAATHRAVVNLLSRLSQERRAGGLDLPMRLVKLRGSGSEADAELEGTEVEVVADSALPALLEGDPATPVVVGSTVWSLWKQMRTASEDGAPVTPWFDAVVIDEASQMKVAEALIALSSMRAGARAILCGDDRQLAPVLRGSYGDDPGSLVGSAFGHFARHYPPMQLRESRRMNSALVAYPRRLFYPGLVSTDPDRRIRLDTELLRPEDRKLLDLFLDPRHAVVLCTYRGVRATARNPFEARLAARLARLARSVLIDPATGERYSADAFVSDALALIAPHRAQNGAILGELRTLGLADAALPVVDTVERMQGNEREMIVFSYGVADREYAEAEAEFLLDPHRFNVAVTRARSKLIVLVSEEVLAALPTDQAVMEGSMALKGYVAHCRHGMREELLEGPDGAPVPVRCRYRSLA